MKNKFKRVKGVNDLYSVESVVVENIYKKAKDIFSFFSYEQIILPHMEEAGVFQKGVGQGTDIVDKQMFKIEGKEIVLRPEATAQVVRFYVENSLNKQRDLHKLYYIGSMFRGERPQKGRLREFHHIGAEVIGSNNIYVDAEVINLASKILKACGIKSFSLKINSLGCGQDKEKLTQSIREQLEKEKAVLCDVCKKRLQHSPLRILDCKKKSCKTVVSSLSIGMDHLCKDCHTDFLKLMGVLKELNVDFVHDPKLVRGLDYYTNTVFEFVSSDLGAQDAVGAGGRYNNLIKNLGGQDLPAVGFALGLERILLLLDMPQKVQVSKVYIATTSEQTYNLGYRILSDLRNEGIGSDIDYKSKSLKAQLKFAQKLGADYVILIGDDELAKETVILRDMNHSEQQEVSLAKIIDIVKEKVNA